MTVTQKDIAKKLGVSRPLVALALSGHPTVAKETRRKIVEMAAKMGYSSFANPEARALIARRYGRKSPVGLIAVLLPSESSTIRQMPFFASFLDGVEHAALQRGCDVLISLRRGKDLPRLIRSRGVDGVVLTSPYPDMIASLVELGLPTVSYCLTDKKINCVTPDDQMGARQALGHLAALGHRRIAYLGVKPEHSAARGRLAGYQAAVRELGLADDAALIDAVLQHQSEQEAAAAFDRLATRNRQAGAGGYTPGFTAVFCYNDVLAIGATRRAQESGLVVPRQLSVVGFDDLTPEFPGAPLLTSVSFPREAMGGKAVELIYANGPQDATPPPQTVAFPTTLVDRGSTAKPE